MKRKEQYADEIIEMLERTKSGAWASNINLNTKDRVIEVCQNCVDSWSGRKFKDHCTTPPQVLEQEPKTVLYSGDGYADGYMVYDMAECPNCGYKYEDGDKDWGLPFCPNCGQLLDWESEVSDAESD